jgi:hypothetical protein
MTDRDKKTSDRQDDLTSAGHDRQGNDKAPGEETSTDQENVVANTQRGRNKNDGDPSKESDRPVDQGKS